MQHFNKLTNYSGDGEEILTHRTKKNRNKKTIKESSSYQQAWRCRGSSRRRGCRWRWSCALSWSGTAASGQHPAPTGPPGPPAIHTKHRSEQRKNYRRYTGNDGGNLGKHEATVHLNKAQVIYLVTAIKNFHHIKKSIFS